VEFVSNSKLRAHKCRMEKTNPLWGSEEPMTLELKTESHTIYQLAKEASEYDILKLAIEEHMCLPEMFPLVFLKRGLSKSSFRKMGNINRYISISIDTINFYY
jgi:hypothetical protein